MKSIIVGTAGHIDHGKTALVKALTGIDADRLEEEKRRGITIDLGFAHMDLPSPNGEILRLGFVDVPGHERFVRNMLAGVGGIDLVLLVIAADESIKPQTREHFDILQLLGVPRGITVLTKSDAVDADTLEVVRLEVEEFLRGTFLETPKSPIVAVSSFTGAGLEELKRAMVAAATELQPRDRHAMVRLPIDRVFTIKGFGTVVTGTLIAGAMRREDELEVFPARRRVRVRGVQVHGSAADMAVAGQRTALNLAGASTQDLARGMTLAPLGTFEPTRRADVSLRLLPSAPHPLKDHARVHFHSATMETVVEIMLHQWKELNPTPAKGSKTGHEQLLSGRESFARIKLPEAVLLLPGDRFIIRQFSPVVTIGGGVVLDAAPIPRMPGLEDFLKIMASAEAKPILIARVARRGQGGISTSRLISESGWTKSVIEAEFCQVGLPQDELAQAAQEDRVVRIGELLIHLPALEALKLHLLEAAADFHKHNPLAGGISKEELREQADAPGELFDSILGMLLREKKIETAGDRVRLPGQGVVLKNEEAESKTIIEQAFANAGLKVPALREVIAGLKVDKARAQQIVTLLLRERLLIKVSDDLVFHRSALEDLRRQMAAYKAKSATIDVGQFKELTGITRKYAIPLLEYLDREHVTRRIGDARNIL
ncbi:MAG: selenocysteine-specific translation elongation factor [Candidatus Sulfotelmatobacter sp.]